MKNTKILTVLGVVLAMGLTACGGNKPADTSTSGNSNPDTTSNTSVAPSSDPASSDPSSSSSSSSSSAAPHTHAYAVSGDVVQNESGKDIYVKECSAKDDKFFGIAFGDYSNKSADFGSTSGYSNVPEALRTSSYLLAKNSTITWNITTTAAVSDAKLEFGVVMTSNSHSTQGVADTDNGGSTIKYSVKANDGEFADWELGSKTYGDVGLKTTTERVYVTFATINLVKGENYITLRQNNAGYRLLFGEEVRIHFTGDAGVSGTHDHTHTFSNEWSSNETQHWHAATCIHTDEKADVGDHTFGDAVVVTAATCEEDGQQKRVCSVCGYEKLEAIKAAHDWNDAVAVEASGEGVAYNKFTCKKCDAIKIEVTLADSMLATGSANKNDPAGFMKLASNNQSYSFKFNYDSSAVGKLYQRGVMDNWTSNPSCHNYNLFSSGKGDGTGADDFEIKLNGEKVDVSAYKSLTYGQVMIGDAIDGVNGEGKTVAGYLSPITDVESGNNIILVNGVNEFSYTRKASYNMSNTHIVFVVKNFSHDHAAGTEWLSDDNSHWNPCVAEGCPIANFKMNEAAHTFGEPVVKTAPTCTETGLSEKECSICGKKVDVVVPALGHDYVAGTVVVNSNSQNVTPLACSRCSSTAFEMGLRDCDGASKIADDGKVTNASELKWTFKVGDKAGTVAFMMHAAMNSDGHDNAFSNGGDKGVYTLKAGENNGTITCGGKQLGKDFGATPTSYVWFQMGVVSFSASDIDANGEIVISIKFPTTQDYRHKYSEGVRIVYIDVPTNGAALVKGEDVKFEAENATPTAWKNSGWDGDATFVANDAEANASGGKFVTPSTGNYDANRKFDIVIYAPLGGTVSMKVAYCRGGKNTKTATIDYSYVYQYKLDGELGKLTCVTENHTESGLGGWNWQLIEFTFTVSEGFHTISGCLDSKNANTNAGCPCIDYYLFNLGA